MNAIKALPSFYRGITFRSRMEARWAVFMDVLGIRYFYEPEGYEIDGTYYLPDFFLPTIDAFLEVKNPLAPEDEWKKCEVLCMTTRKSVFVYPCAPFMPSYDNDASDEQPGYVYFPSRDGRGDEDVGTDGAQWFCQCPHCTRTEIHFQGRADRIHCSCPKSWHGDRGHNYDTPHLRRAYTASLSYRFETEDGWGGAK